MFIERSKMIVVAPAALACVAAAAGALCAASADVELEPQAVRDLGEKPSQPVGIHGPANVRFGLPEAGRALRITGRLGVSGAAWVMDLVGRDNARARLRLVSSDPLEAAMSLDFRLPDGSRVPASRRLEYFIRPNRKLYPGYERKKVFFNRLVERAVFDEYSQLEAKYHLLKSVFEHAFTVHIEYTSEGYAVWLDGRFLAAIPPGRELNRGRITLAKGGEIVCAVDAPGLEQGRYLSLDIRPYARPGALVMDAATSSIVLGASHTIEGVPFFVVEPKHHIDVGLSRWVEEKVDPFTFCDSDTTRTAFDGLPESIVLRAPKANYVAAHLLCVVEPSPRKTPALTLRLTRFGRHSGDSGGRCTEAFADTTRYLPAEGGEGALPEGVTKVGEIEGSPLRRRYRYFMVMEDREKTALPIYHVTAPLKVGLVADLLGEEAPAFGRRRDYWNIELTKEIRTAVSYFNLHNCRRKPLGLPSAVHVLAMTLERSPVDVEVISKEKGNVFYASDRPSFQLRVVNHEAVAAELDVSLEATDIHGKTTIKTLHVKAPSRDEDGGPAEVSIPLVQPTLGHFNAVISVRDKAGRELWREPTAFALLPPDTRRAGDESPFGVWWFVRAHGGCERLDWMGPLLKNMGMRHICPGKFSEEDLAPYSLSYSMVPSRLRGAKRADALLKKNPQVRIGMIFHERGIPDTEQPYPELLGRPKPELSERGKKVFEKYWKQAEEGARWYRENHPNIKLSFGNSGSGLSVWFMRQGWPKKWVDCFGMEGVAAWQMTECQPRRGAMQEVWWLSEMRKIYGYEDVPVSSGYEYIARCTQPGALTEREQADYYARDAIHCLAYGYPSINIGLTDDSADSYSQTIYATSGFLHRNPLLTPKPSYVMYATMTQMLDCAKYVRYLDTGSNSLYALEFARGEERVYAVWTLRGEREATLQLTGRDATLTDSMGNTSSRDVRKGSLALTATTSPKYLTLKGKVSSVTPGKPSYVEAPPAECVVVDDFGDPSRWQVQETADTYLETYATDLLYTRGKCRVRAVDDEEQGKATEIELLPEPEVSKLYARYVSLKLTAPVGLSAPVDRIGVWVKGNSCWGRVFWEFVDARGERYFSTSDETSGWDVSDWKLRTSINFDGWCFVSSKIPRRYPGGFHSPHDRDWSCHGVNTDRVVQHPITVTRLVVALRDWQVYVTDMVPARSRSVRLKDLTVGSGSR